MITWARLDTIQKEVAEVPRGWLYEFAMKHPDSIRKFGKGGKNGTLLFNVADVLKSIGDMGASTAAITKEVIRT